MNEAKEVSVTLKDAEKRITQKFLIYEELTLSSASPIILSCIEETKKSFEGTPDSCTVKATLQIG